GYKYAEILFRNGYCCAKSIAVVDLSTSNGQNAMITLENKFGKGHAIFVTWDVYWKKTIGLNVKVLIRGYCASKYVFLEFSQSLASMYDKTGVRMVIMCPGATATKSANVVNSLPYAVDFLNYSKRSLPV
ncbi:hypothetical protein ALC56_10302, partial [Trachymyrmex septentrionalis]